MGESLLGRFLSKHRLVPFFLTDLAFTLHTAEEIALHEMGLGALLVRWV